MHPEDIAKINEILKSLKDKGNTVLIVEHDPDVIKEGDYIIDMGPGSGKMVVKSHLKEHIMNYSSNTSTGNALRNKHNLKENIREANHFIISVL